MTDAPARTDRGVTLVELILAVALLGTVAVTILAAFGTLIKASDTGRKSGDLSTTLAAVAEATVDNTRNPYLVTCGTPPYDPTAGLVGALPRTLSPGTISIEDVKYWDGANFVMKEQCTTAMLNVVYWHLQQVTIRVATTDGNSARRITVVKRG